MPCRNQQMPATRFVLLSVISLIVFSTLQNDPLSNTKHHELAMNRSQRALYLLLR